MQTSARFGATMLALAATTALAMDPLARCPRPPTDTVVFGLLLLTAALLGAETLRRSVLARSVAFG